MKKITILAGLLLLAIKANAQLKPTKLSVFSNGTYFESKEGKLKFDNGKAAVDVPGTMLQGTFWLQGESPAKIKQINVSVDTVKKAKTSVFLDDYLEGNVGKTMTLRFSLPSINDVVNFKTVSGTLLAFNNSTGLIKFKTTEGKILLISAGTLNDMDLEASANSTFKADTLIRRANIILDKNVAEAPFGQVSMQTGLQWQPSYYVKLETDKDARLIMKATVENGTENDYKDVNVDLVVGTPQMAFGTIYDPVSSLPVPSLYENDYNRGPLRRGYYYTPDAFTVQTGYGFGSGAGIAPPGITRGAYTVVADEEYGDMATAPAMAAVSYAWDQKVDIAKLEDYDAEGTKRADLYYYSAGKVSLPKDAKTLLPISQSTIPYKHVYDAVISDLTNYATNRMVIDNGESKPIDVFHSVKLTNTTKAPLTDASVFIVNENEDPIAQDKISYTPINDEVSIKLAKAIDVLVKNKEEEIGKEDKAKKIGKYTYNKVVLKGTVELANFLDKPITLTVKKVVRGEVTKPDGGTVTKPARYVTDNPLSIVKWEIPLKAGEKKSLVYEYEVYILP